MLIAVHMAAVEGGGVAGAGLAHDDQMGFRLYLNCRELRQRQLSLLPERMLCAERQRQEGLQRPVGRARGVVVLCHNEIRIGIADG
ncbi:hypothetical protein D3C81_2175670 [compost metagenome]